MGAGAATRKENKGIQLSNLSSGDRLRALSAKKAESDAFRQQYDDCKAALVEQGWTADAIEELQAVLLLDLAEGAGVERDFPMPLAERRECWANWFKSKVAESVSGVNQRIRQGNAADTEMAERRTLADKVAQGRQS